MWSSPSVTFLSRFLVVACLIASTASAVCTLTGLPGQRLPDYNDTNGVRSCKAGFYCPNFDPSNSSTYPEACLTWPDCAVTRMWGAQCDEIQGTFEPYVCPAGFYCPFNKGTIIKCPSDALCNVGSTETSSCPALSICNGKQAQNYGVLVYWLGLSVIIIFLYILYSKLALVSTLTDATEGNMTPTPGGSSRDASDQQLVDGFRRCRGNRPPFRLEFMNLAVAVKDQATGKTKSILKDMSGTMEPGTVTAIMGPSGAGKTTFMMALLGKKDPAWDTKGKLLVNGMDKLEALRHSIGFVPQDDVLHKELSVYKNIYYSSETRLPNDWTGTQKAAFRSSIIESLGLTRHRDTVIGDEHERGVSGGQRKRASIGVELAAAPLAMFLDEPTSGLDSTTSLEVCTTLKKIAVETDLTVGMVIHQPRVEIWNGLDQVLFIGKGGRVVYQGSQADAQTFFEKKCGIEFPPEANPADVIIDVIGENSDALADLWKLHSESNSPTLGRTEVRQQAFDTIPEPFAANESGFHGAGFFRQLLLSHNRYMEKQLATMSALRVEMIVCALCGVILGMTFLDFSYAGFYVAPYRRISPLPLTALFPQMNMYSVMSVGLGAAPAGVRVYGLDRYSYYREAAAGYNRVAYFLGTLFSVTYRCVYVSLLFAAIYFFIGGLPIDFGTFFLVLFLIYWNAYAIGMAVSQIISQRMAPLVAQVLVICFAISNGFVAVPVFIKQCAFSFHASQVIMQLWHNPFSHVFEPQFAEWDYKEGQQDLSLWMMFLSSVVFQLIAFALMVATNRDRQK